MGAEEDAEEIGGEEGASARPSRGSAAVVAVAGVAAVAAVAAAAVAAAVGAAEAAWWARYTSSLGRGFDSSSKWDAYLSTGEETQNAQKKKIVRREKGRINERAREHGRNVSTCTNSSGIGACVFSVLRSNTTPAGQRRARTGLT